MLSCSATFPHRACVAIWICELLHSTNLGPQQHALFVDESNAAEHAVERYGHDQDHDEGHRENVDGEQVGQVARGHVLWIGCGRVGGGDLAFCRTWSTY